MIPKRWSSQTINTLCSNIIDCEHKTAPYVESSEFFVITTNTIKNGKLLLSELKNTTKDGFEEWTQREVPTVGDIFFTREAPAGEACMVPKELNVCMGQRMVLLRPDIRKIIPKYLSSYLISHQAKRDIHRLSIGTTVSRINIHDIKGIPCIIPPLPEQTKIANILSTWDKAIETVEKLIENSCAQKKALMQQLLTGKKRFVEFEGEWETVKLSSLCDIRRGASPRPIKDEKWFASDGRGWIRISDVTAQKGQQLLFTTQYLSELGVEKSVSVDPGDLIMSICGTIGVPKFLGIKACIHDGFVIFRNISEHLNLNFLYQYLLYISEQLSARGQPGTQKNLNTTIVGNVLFPTIGTEEQQKIASMLTNADKEIELLEQQLSDLKQEKKALMQQLLTGKRRVIIDTISETLC